MNFRNDDIAFITDKKLKMWIQKNVIKIVKMKFKNKLLSNDEFNNKMH
jgi:hypothetical protein